MTVHRAYRSFAGIGWSDMNEKRGWKKRGRGWVGVSWWFMGIASAVGLWAC